MMYCKIHNTEGPCDECRRQREDEYIRCKWQETDGGLWESSCNNLFEFNADGPKENQFSFCPYCGARIKLQNEARATPRLPCEWLNSLPKYCRDEIIRRTNSKGFSVVIERRTDMEKELFAVIDNADRDFWLDAFDTREEAEAFVKKMEWKEEK